MADLQNAEQLPSYDGSINLSYYTGTQPALHALGNAFYNGAIIQRDLSGTEFAIYEPLAVALSHLLHQAQLPSITAEQLQQLHNSPLFLPEATAQGIQSCRDKGIVDPIDHQAELSKYMSTGHSSLEVAQILLTLVWDAYGSKLGPLRLGTVSFDWANGIQHLVQSTSCGRTRASAKTVWLTCEYDPVTYHDVWYGMCSAPAMGALQEAESEPAAVAGAEMKHAFPNNYPTPASRSPSPSDKKRVHAAEPADPVQPTKRGRPSPAELHFNLDPRLTADQVIAQHPDKLHYDTLLRVAIKYNNTQIRDAINAHNIATNQKQITHPSAIAHRITRACEDLAKRFEIPKDLMRAAFNKARNANKIQASTRCLTDQEVGVYGTLIDAAMAEIQPHEPVRAPMSDDDLEALLAQALNPYLLNTVL